MAKLAPILISFLLAGLFAIALITGGIRLAQVNNSPNSIANDPSITSYASSVNNSLGNSLSNANNAETALGQSPSTLTTTGGSTALGLDTVQGIWKGLKGVPTTIYDLTIGLLVTKIFSGPSFWIVFAVIGSIVTLIIIVAVVKFFTQGEGG